MRRLTARLGRRVERLHRRLQQLQSTERGVPGPAAAAQHEPSDASWARVVAERLADLQADLQALRETLTALEPRLQARGQALRRQVEALEVAQAALHAALAAGAPAVVEAFRTAVALARTESEQMGVEHLVVTAWGQLLRDLPPDVRRALSRDLPPSDVPQQGMPTEGAQPEERG